jgi:hypothetical protein
MDEESGKEERQQEEAEGEHSAKRQNIENND